HRILYIATLSPPVLPFLSFSSLLPPPPSSTLFPYTTLFRSSCRMPPPPTSSRAAPGGALRAAPTGRNSGAASVPLPRVSSTPDRSEEHTSELQSRFDLVCRLLLEKKKKKTNIT